MHTTKIYYNVIKNCVGSHTYLCFNSFNYFPSRNLQYNHRKIFNNCEYLLTELLIFLTFTINRFTGINARIVMLYDMVQGQPSQLLDL